MNKKVTISALPSSVGSPRVDFNDEDFDILLSQKGREVIYEKAILCPCKSEGGDAMPSCKNCGGLGYIYVNPLQTRMVMQSLAYNPKRQDWSLEMAGTVSITSRSEISFSEMDRIIMLDSVSVSNQVIHPKLFKDILFGYLLYKVIEVEHVFLFTSPDSPLTVLEEGTHYNMDNDTIVFDKSILSSYDSLPSVAVRYKHMPQYNVIDIPKDIRRSYKMNAEGRNENIILPSFAIARRTQYVFDIDNGIRSAPIFDNSDK